MSSDESPLDDLGLIHDERSDPVDRAAALGRLAFDHHSLIWVARDWLFHPQPMLRMEAVLKLILVWQLAEDVPAVIEVLHDDPDPTIRSTAAHMLSVFLKNTGQQRDPIIRALVRQLEHEDDPFTQRACYAEILRHLDPRRVAPDAPLDREAHVDWELLTRWRAS